MTEQTGQSLIIDCDKVTRTYSEGPSLLTIFSDISLQVARGETVGIVGSSGAGKTTLLNLLGGLDKPS
ncbi:MAG: ATP-binding cassette domain-containing protein, partial [Reinekea sp.]|nr:ATP-binding cassette domain-containing protein [Reinekea sp.]